MKYFATLSFVLLTSLMYAQGFSITNFDIQVEINKDGSFAIEETIDVYFTEQKRGIFREIEKNYKINNAKVDLGINSINVEGHPYKVDEKRNSVKIRIGDPNVYISGNQRYKIKYNIKHGIISYPEHQEFHYDLTGNEWQAPIDNVNFTIKLPKGITLSPDDLKITGGRKNENLDIAEIQQIDPVTIQGASLKLLKEKEGLTAAIKFPKRYLDVANNHVTFYEPTVPRETEPWYLAIPLAIFGFFLSFWRRLRKTNTDYDTNELQTYPPEGLTSAHVGAFEDQKAHTRDIVSLLPYWGSEGFIEMKNLGDETHLYRLKNLPPHYPEYEHIIFDRLFQDGERAKLSDLKTKFYQTLYKAQVQLTKEVKLQEYYNPEYLRLFRSWRLVLFPLGMIALGVFSVIYLNLIFLAVGFFIAALGGFILPLFRLPLTEKGARLKAEIDAFKRFLRDPEPQLLSEAVHNDPDYFNKMLPFAVAFGYEKAFMSSMEPHMSHAPYWYLMSTNDQSYATFSHAFKPEVIQSAFTSAPAGSSAGSSGGFSSGSGVGGGGGGSW